MPSANMIFGGGGGGLQIKSKQVFTATLASSTKNLDIPIATVDPDKCVVLISFYMTTASYDREKYASAYVLTENNINITFTQSGSGLDGTYAVEIIEIENFKSLQKGINTSAFAVNISPVNYSKCILMYSVHSYSTGRASYGGNWSGILVYIDEVNNKIQASASSSYSGVSKIGCWNLIELE